MVSLTQLLHVISTRPSRARGASSTALKAVVDAVASFVHKYMLDGKAVSIADFGTFTFVIKQGVRHPVFVIAPSFAEQYKIVAPPATADGVPDTSAQVVPLNIFAVATAAKQSQQLVENVIADIVEQVGKSVLKGELVQLDLTFVSVFVTQAKVSFKFKQAFVDMIQKPSSAVPGSARSLRSVYTAASRPAVMSTYGSATDEVSRVNHFTSGTPRSSRPSSARPPSAGRAHATSTNANTNNNDSFSSHHVPEGVPTSARDPLRPSTASSVNKFRPGSASTSRNVPVRPSSAIQKQHQPDILVIDHGQPASTAFTSGAPSSQQQPVQAVHSANEIPAAVPSATPRPLSTQSPLPFAPSPAGSEYSRGDLASRASSLPPGKERSALLKTHITSLYKNAWDVQMAEKAAQMRLEKQEEMDTLARGTADANSALLTEAEKVRQWKEAERQIALENRRRAQEDAVRRREENAPKEAGSILPESRGSNDQPISKAAANAVRRAWDEQVQTKQRRDAEQREIDSRETQEMLERSTRMALNDREEYLKERKRRAALQAAALQSQIRHRDPGIPKFVEQVDVFGRVERKEDRAAVMSAHRVELMEQARKQAEERMRQEAAEKAEIEEKLRIEQEEIAAEKERERAARKVGQESLRQQWSQQEDEKRRRLEQTARLEDEKFRTQKSFIVGPGDSTEQQDRALEIALGGNPGIKKVSTKTRAIYGW
jgi:nucleoid DNA-binding protein